MDPEVFDIVWEMHNELGSRKPVYLISAFRSSATNESLRKRGGGQAKNSQHTKGRAMDVHFPDVPVQRLRYSALVRERGGVGYYPTSALPFVHVDTGNVRMWPRMARDELALLFPSGKTKYVPSDGKPITKSDVERARKSSKHAEAIAAFHAFRASPKDQTMIASLSEDMQPAGNLKSEAVAALDTAKAKPTETKLAAVEPTLAAAKTVDIVAPKPVAVSAWASTSFTAPKPKLLVARQVASLTGDAAAKAPKAAEKPAVAGNALGNLIASLLGTGSDDGAAGKEQARMAALGGPDLPITATVNAPEPSVRKLSVAYPPVPERNPEDDADGLGQGLGDAIAAIVPPEPEPVAGTAFMSRSGWASAPEYDDDHDHELSYRPFPLDPLLTEEPTIDNPVLAALVHPDIAGAHEQIGEADGLRLRFRAGVELAQMMWADRFSAEDVVAKLQAGAADREARRKVRTASQ
jgi:hypothetical protein